MSLRKQGSLVSADDLARGYLVKQGAVRKNWKQRWMVLRDDGCLYYYKNDKDLGRGQAPLGVVNIKSSCLDILCGDECFCQWPVDKVRCFGIVTAERTYFLYAASSADCLVWMKHIRGQSEHLREIDEERQRSRTKVEKSPQLDAGRLSIRLASTTSIMYEPVRPDQCPPVREDEQGTFEDTEEEQEGLGTGTSEERRAQEEPENSFGPASKQQALQEHKDIYEAVQEDEAQQEVYTDTSGLEVNSEEPMAAHGNDKVPTEHVQDAFYEEVSHDDDRPRLGTYVAIGQQQLAGSVVEDSSSEEDDAEGEKSEERNTRIDLDGSPSGTSPSEERLQHGQLQDDAMADEQQGYEDDTIKSDLAHIGNALGYDEHELYDEVQCDENLEHTNKLYQKVTLESDDISDNDQMPVSSHSTEEAESNDASKAYASEKAGTHQRFSASTSLDYGRDDPQASGRFRSVTEPPLPSEVVPHHAMYLPARDRHPQSEKQATEFQAKASQILERVHSRKPGEEPGSPRLQRSSKVESSAEVMLHEGEAPSKTLERIRQAHQSSVPHQASEKQAEQQVSLEELEQKHRLQLAEHERQHRLEMEQQESRYREELQRQEEELRRSLDKERQLLEQQHKAVVAEEQKGRDQKEERSLQVSEEEAARQRRLDSFLLRSQRQHEQRMAERKRKDEEESRRLQEEEELLKEQRALGKQPTARTRPAGSAAQAAKSALAGRQMKLQREDEMLQTGQAEAVTASQPKPSAASQSSEGNTKVSSRPVTKPKPLLHPKPTTTTLPYNEPTETRPEPIPKPDGLMRSAEVTSLADKQPQERTSVPSRAPDIKAKPAVSPNLTPAGSPSSNNSYARDSPSKTVTPTQGGASAWARMKPKLAPKPQAGSTKPLLATKPVQSVADITLRLKQEEAARRREQIEQQRRLRQQREAAEREEEQQRRERIAEERRLREEADKREREKQQQLEQQRRQLYEQNLKKQQSQQASLINVTSTAASVKERQYQAHMERLAAERQRQEEFIQQQREEAERRRREEEERNFQYRERLRHEEARRRQQLQEAEEQLQRERDKQERERAEAKRRREQLEEQAKKLRDERQQMEQQRQKRTAQKPFRQSSTSEDFRQYPFQPVQHTEARNENQPKDTNTSQEEVARLQREQQFDARRKQEEEEAQWRQELEAKQRQQRLEQERERRRQNELKRLQDQKKAEKIRQQTEEVLRRQRQKAEERKRMLEAELRRQEEQEAKLKAKQHNEGTDGVESTKELQKKEAKHHEDVERQKRDEQERVRREKVEEERQQREEEWHRREAEKCLMEEAKHREEQAAFQKKQEEKQRQKEVAKRQHQEELQQKKAAEQEERKCRQEEEVLQQRHKEEEVRKVEERRRQEEAEKHHQEELKHRREEQLHLEEEKRQKEKHEQRASEAKVQEKESKQADRSELKEDEYEASIRRQESRTRDSISRKAKQAAEKLGLDEPPDDPLEELASEEKDKEKVMERRLSVVAQRSAKSKERAEAATKWLDKQIRMLIKEIQQHSEANGGGKTRTTFGVLFRETENIFEALSGLLITARKHKVITYEGEILFQGRDEKVVITLLKTDIPDSTLETYTYRQYRLCSVSRPQKGKGFKATSQQSANAKCHVCEKTVYPMEFISANDLPMHKACFRCTDCNCRLTTSNYAALNNKFYCKTHFESNYKKRGSYAFD